MCQKYGIIRRLAADPDSLLARVREMYRIQTVFVGLMVELCLVLVIGLNQRDWWALRVAGLRWSRRVWSSVSVLLEPEDASTGRYSKQCSQVKCKRKHVCLINGDTGVAECVPKRILRQR
ncbi:hypothetical protein LSH36_165g04000 [Paralvinella palmiformis]|uniref:Uncharacterized protein n=1 Tax=Paralvinella palmiformis TaxID=53620 RepID=A0AAD9JUX2_9ANNE|nr:hypothetical protein LSH36_165g04000 [Paralvinella palmiformis]